jgi:hypothetical protein
MAHRYLLLHCAGRRLASLSHRSAAEQAVHAAIPHHESLHLSCQWAVVLEETSRLRPTLLLVTLGPSPMDPVPRSDEDQTVEIPASTRVCHAKTALRRRPSEVCSRPIHMDSCLLDNDDLTMVSPFVVACSTSFN